jgi:hypothetical protein
MPYDRFLIAPINTGLQTDLRPWLIPDDAFQELTNAYVFRGRVRKRFGSRFMGSGWSSAQTEPLFSRFRINVGTTDGSGNISVTVPGNIFKIGQMFSIGDEIFTVYQTGTPAAMLDTGAATLATYNTSTGALVINGADATTAVWFYPAEPVMGLTNYEVGPINDQPSYGFDTQFAYLFSGGFWQRSGSGSNPIWHGNNLNFYWTFNYRGITPGNVTLFVTNFQVTNPNGSVTVNDDPIWWTSNGSTWTSNTGANAFYFLPAGGAIHTGPYIATSRLIIGFKNRLLLLNTIESDGTTNTNYVNRVRFCHNGSPFATNAWYEPNQRDSSGNIADGAGFLDATTEEAIISAEFIKDRLIVYFERSTWEIAYTGNSVLPFVWQKINTELGSEATFSTVPFDKLILTIGNTGVHACNGANVERIDNKIPDKVFQIVDKNAGVERVAGIRDYFTEMVYWTFPSIEQFPDEVYPSKVLVYNYRNGSWAFNDDCITAWGYFEQQAGETWASTTETWEQADYSWESASVEAQFRQVIAGNQQGYTFIVDSNAEVAKNAQAMQVTNISNDGITLTIIDHTLNVTPYGDYINLLNSGMGIDGIYKVRSIVNINTITIFPVGVITSTYNGGATVARVSNIQILTKQWNPYVDKSRNVYIAKIDFGVLKTSKGQITVDYYPSATELSMLDEATGTGSIQGNGVLETSPYNPLYYPLEQVQDRLWHPIYFQTEGECIQLFIYMTQPQMTNPLIAFSPFQLEGMVLHTMATTGRLE